MGKAITRDDHYEADVATVFGVITDEKFVVAKYEALDMTDISLLEHGPTADGGWRTKSQRSAETKGIPDIAKKVFGSRQTIVQTEEWGPAAADGTRQGTFLVETKGTPATVRGTSKLRPEGTGSVVEIRGELKVGVPLIGGKIEGAVLPTVEDEMRKEHDFGVTWLAEA